MTNVDFQIITTPENYVFEKTIIIDNNSILTLIVDNEIWIKCCNITTYLQHKNYD